MIAFAQEGSTGQSDGRRLVISSSDASTVPTILLRAYGADAAGQPLSLMPDEIQIMHAGQPATNVELIGDYKAGTMTVFVVDTPPGVEAQLPAIQEAIEQFASPPEMEEPVDYIAIYQVSESQASQLLPPTNFYNGVRNFFADQLETQSGPTALLDSLDALLDEMPSLRPKDDLAMSVVLLTDGTDVVSTRIQPEDLGPKAASLGIPIHTIWLENENLQSFSQQAGQDYLAQVAAASGGVAANLNDSAELQAIWERILAFRNHRVIQYQPENLTSGAAEVVLSLVDDPTLQATTTVTISPAAPSVTLNLPPESRQLTLESLDEPITLSLSATASWLDGVERELQNAELLVNGTVVQAVDVRDLDRFKAEISSFDYGPNTIQVRIVDEAGAQAISPAVTLTILEGETQVPDDIQSSGFQPTRLLSLVAGCFLVIFLLAVFIVIIIAIRRRRKDDRRRPRSAELGPSPDSTYSEDENTGNSGLAYIEVLNAVTRMPAAIQLTSVEHRLGRNPMQADIPFENDITMSRLHASVVLEGSDYRIYDQDSTSGTWVNGQQVPGWGVQLVDGDEIILGDVRIRYRRQ